MKLIKLSAISSTNDYLKELSAITKLDDFTVVWADVQTKGKGQMGAAWVTQEAKNLTFSVLLNNKKFTANHLFTLNIIVANAILRALLALNLTNIYVKWPNDILSYNKKIAGILIENTITGTTEIKSVIGIGINIDQSDFDGFPQASSVFNQYNITIDKKQLLYVIVNFIKTGVQNIHEYAEKEWQFYHKHLFKKDQISVFEDKNGIKFNGIIKQVNRIGQLQIQLTNNDLKEYNLKEIKLLY